MAANKKSLCKFLYFALFGAVLIVFILKFALLMGRYGITAAGTMCEQSIFNGSQTINVTFKVSHEYIFTVIMYGIVSVLRLVEYCILAQKFYNFLFCQDEIDPSEFFKKHPRRFRYVLLFFSILLPYLLLGFIVPGLGIYQEIEYSERLANCYRHYYEVYVAYCAINTLRFISAYLVRLMMIFITLTLSKYWSYTNDNDSDTVVEGYADLSMREKEVSDWKVVSADYQKRVKDYAAIGKQVQEVQEIFQTWFIVPWMVYIIASSLKGYNILHPWHADGNVYGDIPSVDISQIYIYCSIMPTSSSHC